MVTLKATTSVDCEICKVQESLHKEVSFTGKASSESHSRHSQLFLQWSYWQGTVIDWHTAGFVLMRSQCSFSCVCIMNYLYGVLICKTHSYLFVSLQTLGKTLVMLFALAKNGWVFVEISNCQCGPSFVIISQMGHYWFKHALQKELLRLDAC